MPEPRHCVVFSWVPGPGLARALAPENLAKMGALAAQLHAHAETFEPCPSFCVRTKNSGFPYREPTLLFDRQYRELVPPDRRRIYQRAAGCVAEAVERLHAAGKRPIVIHNDLHQ